MTQEDPAPRRQSRLGPSYLTRWIAWDVWVVLIACVLTILAGIRFDIVEKFYIFTRDHDDWELDEFALVFVTLSVGGLLLSLRRYLQVRAEFRRRAEAESHLEYLATNDSLTGLANRRAFMKRLGACLDPADTTDYAVVMIDLDRFKPVNDLYGHDIGDRLLQQVSERMQAQLKPQDFLARLGGDEFAAILSDASGDEELDRVVTRLLRTIAERIEIGRIVCNIDASAGIAFVHPQTNLSVSQILKQADMALYSAKERGRGRHVYFDEEMNEKATLRLALEADLGEAIRTGQVQPHYQPLIRFSDNAVEGYEILARWDHPDMGMVPPDRFIPIAEDSGLINELTFTLFRKVCEEAQTWPKGLFVSLNISPVQLRTENIVEDLLAILAEFGLPADFLEVEITENAVIHDVEEAAIVLNRMAEAGIRLALDDFGTGYSSLHHLRQLPFSKLKIDKSFIIGMEDSPESRKIIRSVLSLSNSLGLSCTAEGVETESTAEWLKEAGCGLGQGYYFGRPSRQLLSFDANGAPLLDLSDVKNAPAQDEADTALPKPKRRASNE